MPLKNISAQNTIYCVLKNDLYLYLDTTPFCGYN